MRSSKNLDQHLTFQMRDFQNDERCSSIRNNSQVSDTEEFVIIKSNEQSTTPRNNMFAKEGSAGSTGSRLATYHSKVTFGVRGRVRGLTEHLPENIKQHPKRKYCFDQCGFLFKWILTIACLWCAIMFFVAAFVCGFNILLEFALYLGQLWMTVKSHQERVLLVFVFVPHLIILAILKYKILSLFWKVILIVWYNKGDNMYLTCCKTKSDIVYNISYGSILRLLITICLIIGIVLQYRRVAKKLGESAIEYNEKVRAIFFFFFFLGLFAIVFCCVQKSNQKRLKKIVS